jgi:hypothetical protein
MQQRDGIFLPLIASPKVLYLFFDELVVLSPSAARTTNKQTLNEQRTSVKVRMEKTALAC